MSDVHDPPEASSEGVRALVDGVRARLLRRAGVAVVLWMLVLTSLVLAAGWLLAGPDGWARSSAVPLLLDLILAAGLVGGGTVLLRRVRKRLADPPLARELDRVAGFGRGTVLGALELCEAVPEGVSAPLADRGGSRVAGALRATDPGELAGPLAEPFVRSARTASAVLAVTVPALILLFVSAPERSAGAWGGMLRPASVLAAPALPPLGITPGDSALPRGRILDVRVEAPGRERVRLAWRFEGDVERTAEARVGEGGARFDLGPLEAPVTYRATAPDGARTDEVRVEPLDPLLLTDLRVEVVAPPHTGEPPGRFERPVPPLEIPEGSLLRIRGRASRPLETAVLRPSDERGDEASGVVLDAEGDAFSGEWTPTAGGRYEWTLATGEGEVPEAAPPPLEIRLLPDSAPSVEVTFPGRDTLLPLDRRQPLVVRARDDYGVDRVILEARGVSESGEASDSLVREIDVGELRAAVVRPVLDVSEWELLRGDVVRYRVRVEDNAPRARTAESPEYVLRVARRSEAERVVQERLEQTAEAVDSLAAEAAEAGERTRELRRRALERRDERAASARSPEGGTDARSGVDDRPTESGSFEGREDARAALERQERLMSGVDSVRQRLDEMQRDLDRAALADPDLRRDLDELRSLMDRMAPDEMRESVRDDLERLEEMDAEELEEALSRLAREQDELRRRVEESLDRFRRAAAEQDFRATAREARDLAREQGSLAETMEGGDEEERSDGDGDAGGDEDREGDADRQRELAERTDELRQRLDSLEQRLTSLGETEAGQGVRNARERSGDAAGRMQRAESLRRDDRGPEAADQARSAADDLRSAADELDRSRQRMAERREDRLRDAFERTASESLALARRQEELRERMRGADREEQARLSGDQSALLEGLENLSESLAEPAAESPETGGDVRQAVEEAREAAARTLEALSGQQDGASPTPSSASSRAVQALNQAARAAGRAARQPGSRGEGAGQGIQQALREVAARQGELAEQSGAMQQSRTGPGEQGGRLGELAEGQGSVAGELGDLADRPESNGLLGDLESLTEEARELTRELEDGRLDPETVRRQERLFHRLLDAGRTLESDERSDEREGATAEVVPPREVEPLAQEVLDADRIGAPPTEVLHSLPPAQRALVLRYFERLNRTLEGSSGEAP